MRVMFLTEAPEAVRSNDRSNKFHHITTGRHSTSQGRHMEMSNRRTATKVDLARTRRDNLLTLIAERFEGSQAQFAAAAKMTANYTWRLTTAGVHAKNMGEETARQIEANLDLPPYSMDKPELGVVQELPDEGATGHSLPPAQPAGLPAPVSVVTIASLSALHGKVSAAWVKKEGVAEVFSARNHSPSAFATAIPDQSMAPAFRQGDMVVIDPEEAPRPGDHVLARVGKDIVFRHYRPSRESGPFQLAAGSDNHAPIWSDRDQVSIVGVMVEHHRYRETQYG